MIRVSVKVPKGWRLLRKGEMIEKCDKFLSESSGLWMGCAFSIGLACDGTVARRITGKRKGAK